MGNLSTNEMKLVVKVFKAQLRNPSKGDWTTLIKNDLEEFGIQETFDEISKLSKVSFKKKVAIACRKFTLKKLLDLKESHSNGRNLTHNILRVRKYLVLNELSVKDAKFLFKIRSEMLNVRANFKHKYLNQVELLYCQHCQKKGVNQIQTQEHILICEGLEQKVDIQYNDLFSLNLSIVNVALEGFKVAWDQSSED